MQGEELAKVSENDTRTTSFAAWPREMIPEKMFSIGYTFPRANP